jgi:signal transduction histidine kinase
MLALARSDLQQHGIVLRTDLSANNQPVFDNTHRFHAVHDQVQQHLLQLNPVTRTDRPKVLAITSEPVESGGALVAVEDTGTGLDPATAERIFDLFFTTKPSGMGMGLSICHQSSTPMAGACGCPAGAVRDLLSVHCANSTAGRTIVRSNSLTKGFRRSRHRLSAT